jgi:hypothetical protein
LCPPCANAGPRLAPAPPRIGSTATDLLTFQFDKWGGGFVIELAVAPPDEFVTYWGTPIPARKLTVFDLPRVARVRLQPGRDRSGAESWFRYDTDMPGRSEARFERAADQVLQLLPQADAWWAGRDRSRTFFSRTLRMTGEPRRGPRRDSRRRRGKPGQEKLMTSACQGARPRAELRAVRRHGDEPQRRRSLRRVPRLRHVRAVRKPGMWPAMTGGAGCRPARCAGSRARTPGGESGRGGPERDRTGRG